MRYGRHIYVGGFPAAVGDKVNATVIDGVNQIGYKAVAGYRAEEMVFYVVLKALQMAVDIVGYMVGRDLLYTAHEGIGFYASAAGKPLSQALPQFIV
jgi:hypothetical protein